MLAKSTATRHRLRFVMLPLVSAIWLGVAPAAYADEPVQSGGTSTISLTPVPERTADGNTFIDYTFTETMLGIIDGTRVGSGELVIHTDGSFNTINSGTFIGTIAGWSGTAEMSFRISGTFASAAGSFTVTGGTGGLAGVHAEGKTSGSATGPTTFAGAYSVKVNVTGP